MVKNLSFCLFVLGVTDLILTLTLINHFGNIESNPIAGVFCEKNQYLHLAFYKLFWISVVLGLVAYISFKSRFHALLVLYVGCVFHLITIIYTIVLIGVFL